MTRSGRVYTPKTTLARERAVAAAYRAAGGPVFDGPVRLHVAYTTTHEVITITSIEAPSRLRGDIDNYIKTTSDGLNGVAWADDRQVVEIEATKEEATPPKNPRKKRS